MRMSYAKRRSIFIAVALVPGGLTAAAEGYCVACFEPDAVYRCLVEGVPGGAAPDPRHQVQCIKQLAKQGGHARCSVERFSAAGCDGPVAMIDPENSAIPMGPVTPETGAAPASQRLAPEEPVAIEAETEALPAQEPEAKPNTNEPPRTVEELAKNAAESTKKGIDTVTGTVTDTTKKAGDQIQGAGSAVGNAAKKSWNCLTSLFNDC